ncbi:MAG: threonine ammonia-lyase [Nitrososphaeraceae archaeon]|nr:threonine ammonia-lyase [Nitrososphaeraceae archaeon]MDW0136573.1 threonine ammonia-lyase [Nitrososphaeraceae archaeon]MDW0141797.1 threonine ammonia-lyase [Nitrososphaeraceae archaeon]MDW0145444.1 threonine ammonia-lyase [Nitrososphaeraceae archaeon]MDW0157839.1 threonine ammonia-lyase [Nitrososphaeraceae archaeon]
MNNLSKMYVKDKIPLVEDILRAQKLMNKADVRKTPLLKSNTFSNTAGTNIYLKFESFQKTGSFKVRGAYSKINSLTNAQRKAGVIAASAGNHAQGVAYAALKRNIKCNIVMPKNASPAKVAATRSYGANVVLSGNTYDESWETAYSLSSENGYSIIHAFDDPVVIAGQGTIGLELMEDLKDIDTIYLPLGGGGLASGVCIAIKAKRPDVKIVGVESNQFPAMKKSLEKGSLCHIEGGFSIADGISVKSPGELTFEICSKYLDDVVTVDDVAIVETMFTLMEREKVVVEPAGAASLAYVLSSGKIKNNQNIISILSGGNIDMYLLGQIVSKGLMQMGRLVKIFIQLPDKPGALKSVVDKIAEISVNIVQVEHDRLSSNVAAGSAGVYLSLELENEKHSRKLLDFLKKEKMVFKVVT